MVRYCRLFNVFEAFSCKIGDPHVFSRSRIKVAEGFPIISNLAVTTRITMNYYRANFFSSGSLNRKSVLSLHLDLKIIFSLFSIIFNFRCKFPLCLNEVLNFCKNSNICWWYKSWCNFVKQQEMKELVAAFYHFCNKYL